MLKKKILLQVLSKKQPDVGLQSSVLDPWFMHWTVLYGTFLFWEIQSKDENIFQDRKICSFSNYKLVLALNPNITGRNMTAISSSSRTWIWIWSSFLTLRRCTCAHWSLTLSAKMANQEGVDVRRIPKTRDFKTLFRRQCFANLHWIPIA